MIPRSYIISLKMTHRARTHTFHNGRSLRFGDGGGGGGGGGTHGSMLTGVASLIADRTGGVMSQLSKGAATQNSLSDVFTHHTSSLMRETTI